MKDDGEAFFSLEKAISWVFTKSLSDCQAQVGSSISAPPASVYKGYSMPKEAEKYLLTCVLMNALYSIRATDLTEEVFGTLVPCPALPSSGGETSSEPLTKKRSQKALYSDCGGLWRVKNRNISGLYKEAKQLKDKLNSFQIIPVLKDLNSEADNQASLAVNLAEGQAREEIEK